MRPCQGLLDPDRAGEASRRSPGGGADAPPLAGRLRVWAAGRRRADSGALRARRGSHSDEIPVPGQRHQPASAFLLPSQIETEGGGREVEKKKANKKGREEKPRRCSGLTSSSLLQRSPEARRRAPPPRKDPALGLRAGRAPRLCRGKQGLIKLERNFSQLLMNRRLGSRPSPPPRPSPFAPPPPHFLFFSASALVWKAPGCGAVGASPRRRGRAEAAGPGCLSQHPAILGSCGRGRGGRGSGRAHSRVLQRFLSFCLSFSFSFFFFFSRGELAASLKLGETEGRKCQVPISLHLCSTHPGPFQKIKKD